MKAAPDRRVEAHVSEKRECSARKGRLRRRCGHDRGHVRCVPDSAAALVCAPPLIYSPPDAGHVTTNRLGHALGEKINRLALFFS